MNIVSIQGLAKTLGDKPLLRDASVGIDDGDRIGLIGVNGCGKSTLLRIIAGAEPPDAGTVARRQDLPLALLDQVETFDPEHTALDHLFAAGGPHADLVRDWHALAAALHDRPGDPALLRRQGELTARLDALGAWAFESRARTVLGHLGLDHLDRPLASLSGGERKRVALARVLLAEPQLLLLDEPTNHLDTDMIDWLEGWLAAFSGALVMVTHDRYFLDRVVRRIWEVDRTELRVFDGNYAHYTRRKAEIEADFAKKEDRRLNQLRRELEWLQHGPKARTTKAKARIDRAAELQEADFSRDRPRLQFQAGARRMGKKVVELEQVDFAYAGAEPVVRDLDYVMPPGEALGIVGPNGCGKSTLANLIAGRLQPTAGSLRLGQTISIGYFDQESSAFDPDERAIDFIKREGGEAVRTHDGRTLTAALFLERFHFTPRMQYAPVARLSGGERRRLDLVRTLLRDPNFLILDEPTNDLDIPTLQSLEEYLDSFAGCLIVISHDRYFLDRVVDRVLAPAGDGHWRLHPGGYSVYAQWRDEQRSAERKQKAQAPPLAGPKPKSTDASRTPKLGFNEKRELARLEKEIPEMEQQLQAIQDAIPAASADYEALHRLTTQQADLHTRLDAAMERWAELAERADSP